MIKRNFPGGCFVYSIHDRFEKLLQDFNFRRNGKRCEREYLGRSKETGDILLMI